MKLAIYQSRATDGDIDTAFDVAATMLDAAARAGAAMLVLPELYLPGYNRPDLHASMAQPLDGPWLHRLSAMARAAGCGLTLGFAERADGTVFNSAVAFGADGERLGCHRKIQLYGAMERESFGPGKAQYAVFDYGGVRTGLLICYDVEFPGHVAALRDLGVELILVPTANPSGYEHVSRALVPARAHEGRAVIAYANYCGAEAGLQFGGLSLIAGPDAQPLVQAGTGEALLIADLSGVAGIPADRLSAQAEEYRAP